MQLGLNGQVALVTGGGQGVGRQICLELAAEGARVVVNDLFEERAQAVADEITAAGGQENIREFFVSFPVQAARQFLHSHAIQVDGDRGSGTSYLDGRPVRDGKSYYVVGRFDDEYIRIDGRWVFQRVVLTVHYMVEASDRWDRLIPLKKPSPELQRNGLPCST